MILTMNEQHVLRLLATSINTHLSINEISRACAITPNGAYKILIKLETQGILKAVRIANIKSYTLDFDHEKTTRVLELAFIPDTLEGRIKSRAVDLQRLRTVTQACILFGSYITAKKTPNDLDVLFILRQKDFETYKRTLSKAQDLVPVKIQDIIQTTDDLQHNLTKNDPVVTAALRHGIVLWGSAALVEVIKNASQR